jgi:hypothetical protein
MLTYSTADGDDLASIDPRYVSAIHTLHYISGLYLQFISGLDLDMLSVRACCFHHSFSLSLSNIRISVHWLHWVAPASANRAMDAEPSERF